MSAAVKAAQPPGVSDPIYDCTYPDSAVKLVVHVDDHQEACICGAEDGKDMVYVQPRDFGKAPAISLTGENLDLESYYTLILSNPDDILVDGGLYPVIGPIIHEFVGNIKGSAFVEGDFSTADTVWEWYAPHPVLPHEVAHFCYLVYKQEQGVEDYADVEEMEQTLFPVRDVAARHHLTLLTSNWYAATNSRSFNTMQ